MPKYPTYSIPQGSNAEVFKDTLITIGVPTCNYSKVNLSFVDTAGVNQEVFFLNSPVMNLSGGALVSAETVNNNSPNVGASLTFLANNENIGKTYELFCKVKKYSCPITLEKTFVLKVKIFSKNYAYITTQNGAEFGTVCEGDPIGLTAQTYRPDSTTNMPSMIKYYWDTTQGIKPINANDKVVYATPSQTTKYKVRLINELYSGCIDTASVTVYVKPYPSDSVQIGYFNAKAIAVGPNIIYRWYNIRGTLVGSADTFTAQFPDEYYLEVTDTTFGFNCTSWSPSFNLPSEQLLVKSPMKIFPNPATESIMIEGLPVENSVNFISPIGAKNIIFPQPNGKIPLSSLSPGLYIVETQYKGKFYRQQLVIGR